MQGKILTKECFTKQLEGIKRKNPKKLLAESQKEISELIRQQKAVAKQYQIHKQHNTIFRIARDSIFVKNISKDAQFYSYYAYENIFKELGRRGGLTLQQVTYLTFNEYQDLLLKNKDFSALTNQRMKYSLHFSTKGKTYFYIGKEAKKIRKKIKFADEIHVPTSSNKLKGNPAYPGKVKGRVKIINTVQEMMKMHDGNILVSHMTNPDIVPAMKQARAIVTDLGGITCHAAIISRELKIPCVIGTKVATQVLKDGDEIQVDAHKGIVQKIN